MIRGVTNGDDAVVVGENYVGANDGVGAWATKEKGHAAYVTSIIFLLYDDRGRHTSITIGL
jgi:hypothetical protein